MQICCSVTLFIDGLIVLLDLLLLVVFLLDFLARRIGVSDGQTLWVLVPRVGGAGAEVADQVVAAEAAGLAVAALVVGGLSRSACCGKMKERVGWLTAPGSSYLPASWQMRQLSPSHLCFFGGCPAWYRSWCRLKLRKAPCLWQSRQWYL